MRPLFILFCLIVAAVGQTPDTLYLIKENSTGNGRQPLALSPAGVDAAFEWDQDTGNYVLAPIPAAASQAEMEAGTEAAIRQVSPLRVAQAIAALAGTGSGDLVGPASSTDGNLLAFDGVTGKLAKDSAIPMASVAYEGGPAVDIDIQALIIVESGAGPTLAAGEGSYWVKNTVPNTPWFKDDAGTEFELPTKGNIAVADLANGTDGELISWDATGAPSVIGAGTAGQVLTSNGAGNEPSMQALPPDVKEVTLALSDLTTSITAGATVVGYWDAPAAITLTDVWGTALTAPTGSGLVIDVHVGAPSADGSGATTIMTTNKIAIDATQFQSDDAATQPTLTTTAITGGQRFFFFFDVVGSTEGGKGIQATIEYTVD